MEEYPSFQDVTVGLVTMSIIMRYINSLVLNPVRQLLLTTIRSYSQMEQFATLTMRRTLTCTLHFEEAETISELSHASIW